MKRSIGVRVSNKGGRSGTWLNVYPSWALIPSLVSQRMGARAFGSVSGHSAGQSSVGAQCTVLPRPKLQDRPGGANMSRGREKLNCSYTGPGLWGLSPHIWAVGP